jgi:hypothetical protein
MIGFAASGEEGPPDAGGSRGVSLRVQNPNYPQVEVNCGFLAFHLDSGASPVSVTGFLMID